MKYTLVVYVIYLQENHAQFIFNLENLRLYNTVSGIPTHINALSTMNTTAISLHGVSL